MLARRAVFVDEVRDAVARLEELINAHDVVFLLTDTRESRWLPTLVRASRLPLHFTFRANPSHNLTHPSKHILILAAQLCAARDDPNALTLNAALGFDTCVR